MKKDVLYKYFTQLAIEYSKHSLQTSQNDNNLIPIYSTHLQSTVQLTQCLSLRICYMTLLIWHEFHFSHLKISRINQKNSTISEQKHLEF